MDLSNVKMGEQFAGGKYSARRIEDCCPDVVYAKLLSNLKQIFKHDDFKSKLQEQAVKKVAIRKFFSSNKALGLAVSSLPPSFSLTD